MLCAIALTQGKVAIVDAEDWIELSKYRWQATHKGDGTYYAKRVDSATGKEIKMHRQITGALPGEDVDHRDGDGLNNRRSNLRRCTHQQNTAAKRKLKPGSSAYKGVSKSGNQWRARIEPNGAKVELGRFLDEVSAARAYDAAARQHFGEFARTNFMEP